MVRRIYAEKRPGLNPEAGGLLTDLRDFLGIQGLTGVRILHRYDVENLDAEAFAGNGDHLIRAAGGYRLG